MASLPKSRLRQCPLEPVIRLLHIHLQLPRLLLPDLFGSLHLVKRDKPLHYLAPVLKVLVRHPVDRLYNVRQQRVQLVLGQEAELYGVEEGDKLLRRLGYEHAVGARGRGRRRRRRRGGRRHGRGHADADALRRAGDFQTPLRLELLQPHEGLGYRLIFEEGLVLLERAVAYLGVLRLGDGVLEEGLLELVEGYEDAEDFGEGVFEVAFGGGLGELDFLVGGLGGVLGEGAKLGGGLVGLVGAWGVDEGGQNKDMWGWG